jgi:hypothetical protein
MSHALPFANKCRARSFFNNSSAILQLEIEMPFQAGKCHADGGADGSEKEKGKLMAKVGRYGLIR